MRITRILAAAATSVVLVLPTVSAVQASADTASTTTASDVRSAPKPHRYIDSRIVNVNPQHLQIRTKVRNYPASPTFLQKKLCKSCVWKQVAKKQTSRFSRVAYPVSAPRHGRWYYRVGTPVRVNFARSFGQAFYTYQY